MLPEAIWGPAAATSPQGNVAPALWRLHPKAVDTDPNAMYCSYREWAEVSLHF